MLVRTLCFIGAVVVGAGWVRWAMVAGAVFLPYLAVVLANNAAPRTAGTDLVPAHQGYKELGG